MIVYKIIVYVYKNNISLKIEYMYVEQVRKRYSTSFDKTIRRNIIFILLLKLYSNLILNVHFRKDYILFYNVENIDHVKLHKNLFYAIELARHAKLD